MPRKQQRKFDVLGDLTPSQRELADYMSELSEEAYCAGWMDDMEYVLWQAVMDVPQEYGRLRIDSVITSRLLQFSHKIGGWIIFHDGWEETFVPLPEWRSMYERWAAGVPKPLVPQASEGMSVA